MRSAVMVPDWRLKELEAEVDHIERCTEAAYGRLERTASELAGSDETLRRILRARLRDAYREGLFLGLDH